MAVHTLFLLHSHLLAVRNAVFPLQTPASCYEKMGDLDHSVEVYTSFLAKDPACPGADVVKEQLNQLLLRKNGAQVSK